MFASVSFDQNYLENILSTRAVDLLPEISLVCSVAFGYLGPVLQFLTI